MNEEEIKIKIVLPFLERLGISPSELTFEKGFFIKVGRQDLAISSRQKQHAGAGARLDILVTRNGRNLLVLEIKEASHVLADADRDQAISYARLIHPIAPYALVTNGIEWKLFDSITKEAIVPDTTKLKDDFVLNLPEDLRNEALELFLGFSTENIKSFCEKQVQAQMKPLIGSRSELTKKFIPELNVPRNDLVQKIDDFIQSGEEGFLVLADSGMGKTSALCHNALRLLDKQIAVLFFRGWSLESGILAAIAEEFNWSFSEEQNSIDLIHKLHRVLKIKPAVVIIDAIDEWSYPQKAQNLFTVLKNVRGQHVKFILSCKTGSWKMFSEAMDCSTGIEEYLHPVPTPDGEMGDHAYRLKDFDSQEFYRAVEKYRDVFHFDGGIENQVLNEAKRNPFLLRVLFEVAAQAELRDLTFSSTQLFEEYYKRLLMKTDIQEIAAAQLQATAKSIWEENNGWIEISKLREKLGMRLNESLHHVLFEQNILIRSSDDAEHLGFYFQQLRDFIIGFKVFGWQKLDQGEFESAVQAYQGKEQAFRQEGVQADVLSFYFRQASMVHKRVLAGELYDEARKYLNCYVEILGRHFPLNKEIFEPHTEGQIGSVGEIFVMKRCLAGYGFRKIEADEEPVLFVPVNEMFSSPNLFGGHGGTLHYSGSENGFVDLKDVQELVENEIIYQIEKLVKAKRLYEGKAPELLFAHVIVGLYGGQPKTFRPLFDASQELLQYPIQVSRVAELLLREKLTLEFQNELVEQKRKSGAVVDVVTKTGGLTYSCTIFPPEMAEIDDRVNQAVTSGVFPKFKTNYSHIRLMENYLQQATREGYKEIREPRWVERYMLMDTLRANPEVGLRDVKKYLLNIFEAFLENYILLVESNFPTIKGSFVLFSQMPVHVLVGVSPDLPSGINSGWWGGEACHIKIAICKNPNVRSNSVSICAANEIQIASEKITFKGRDYDVLELNYRTFIELTSCLDPINGNPIGNLVYDRIQSELPAALTVLRELERKKTDSQSNNFQGKSQP